jgi:hypothetical protein
MVTVASDFLSMLNGKWSSQKFQEHFHVSAATGKQNGGRNNDQSASLPKGSCELLPSLGVRRRRPSYVVNFVRFLILLTVLELLPKTCNFTICSIFSNSGHVGWCTASPDTILKLDTLVMIQTKFGFHWSSTFRGEDF